MALSVIEELRVGILAGLVEDEWYKNRRIGPERIARWSQGIAAQWLRALGAPMLTDGEREALASEMRERIFPDDDDNNGCDGHESLNGADMGRSVFCDGTCKSRR